MKYSFAKVRAEHILSTQARIIECRLVGVERRAGWVQNNNRLRYRVGNPAKFAFLLPQFLLSLLEGLDVGTYSIPADHVGHFVAKWFDANQKPPISSVEPTNPSLNLPRLL